MRGDLNSKMSSITKAFEKGKAKFVKPINDIIMQAKQYEIEARENVIVAERDDVR